MNTICLVENATRQTDYSRRARGVLWQNSEWTSRPCVAPDAETAEAMLFRRCAAALPNRRCEKTLDAWRSDLTAVSRLRMIADVFSIPEISLYFKDNSPRITQAPCLLYARMIALMGQFERRYATVIGHQTGPAFAVPCEARCSAYSL